MARINSTDMSESFRDKDTWSGFVGGRDSVRVARAGYVELGASQVWELTRQFELVSLS